MKNYSQEINSKVKCIHYMFFLCSQILNLLFCFIFCIIPHSFIDVFTQFLWQNKDVYEHFQDIFCIFLLLFYYHYYFLIITARFNEQSKVACRQVERKQDQPHKLLSLWSKSFKRLMFKDKPTPFSCQIKSSQISFVIIVQVQRN